MALLLVVVVVGVAAIGNRVARALAAVWAAVWFDFLYRAVLPVHDPQLGGCRNTRVLLLVTGLAVWQLAVAGPAAEGHTVTDAGYLAQIHETASLAESARVPDVVVDHVRSSSSACSDLDGAASSTGPCSATRRAWSRTGP